MSWPEHVPSAVPVLYAEHVFAVFRIAPALLPQFDRLQRRQQNFACADSVHLFAHDALSLLEAAQAKRKEVICPRGELANQSCADHQLMTRDDRIGGRLF